MTDVINQPTTEEKMKLASLQERLAYHFSDLALLQRALIHSSFAFEQREQGDDNELLEFLGDAVLELTIGSMLFTTYPDMREGELTRLRSALVNERNLAAMARGVNLGEHLLLGRGEEGSDGRQKASILSCAYEAVVGAIFVDSSYDRAMEFVARHFRPLLKGQKDMLLTGDAKSLLQEKMQAAFNEAPLYRTEQVDGPAHDRRFTVAVLFRDEVLGSGRARSKKEAEQLAAEEALRKMAEGE
jgi:ribonuclease-3